MSEEFDPAHEFSVNNPHDAAFKAAFRKKELARKFLAQYLPPEILQHIDLEHLRFINKSYLDENQNPSAGVAAGDLSRQSAVARADDLFRSDAGC
jgi:hypothetical protein